MSSKVWEVHPYRWGETQIKKLLSDYQLFLGDLAQSNSAYGYYLGNVRLSQIISTKSQLA